MRRGGLLGTFAAVASVTALLPASASAAVNCAPDGTSLAIEVTSGSTAVFIERGTGPAADQVRVYAGFDTTGGPLSCGATFDVNNFDSINIDEVATGQGTTVTFSYVNGEFAPGLTPEAASSEIEVSYETNADNAGVDQFNIKGGDGAENIRFGTTGLGNSVNMNGAETTGVDTDAVLVGVDRTFSDLGDGNDIYTGDGSGLPSGATPTPTEMVVGGGGGDDTLTAGSAANGNSIDGEDDDDVLTGGTGADSIRPGLGNDTVDGGGGSGDFLSYLNANDAVTVDLRITAPQDTIGQGIDSVSNTEGIIGSNASDTLIGTDGPTGDTLVGGQLANDLAADHLIGGGGPDVLTGGKGDDVLEGGAGNDSLIGMDGTDTASFANAAGGVTFSLDPALTGMGQVTGGDGTDTLTDDQFEAGMDARIENITGSGFGDDLTGNEERNRIVGGLGTDSISLRGESDTFDIWDGLADTVDCGDGNDEGLADEDDRDIAGPAQGCETTDFAPQTAIAAGPADGATTTDDTPTYDLSADEPSTFEYAIDADGFQACPATCTLPALSAGTHTLRFRATDTDSFPHFDLVPAARTLTVTPPPGNPTPPAAKKCKKPKKKKGRSAAVAKKKKCKKRKKRK